MGLSIMAGIPLFSCLNWPGVVFELVFSGGELFFRHKGGGGHGQKSLNAAQDVAFLVFLPVFATGKNQPGAALEHL